MRSNNRLGTHDVATLRTMVSARDLELLHLVREHRFLTTRQIQRLLFWDHATVSAGTRACVRVLTRLHQRKLLSRLERQIGGTRAGSASYVWAIDDAGDRLLRSEPGQVQAKRSRTFEPSRLFLTHTLAVAEVRVLLEEAAHIGHLEQMSVTTEPENWRTFLTSSGTVQRVKPDLHAVTVVGEFEDHWFIEIDQGTESLPTLIGKCLIYQRYYATRREQAAHGIYPAVVWLITDQTRRSRLDAAIRAHKHLNAQLFHVLAPEEFIPFVISDRPAPN